MSRVREAMAGALQLMRYDRDGLAKFDNSVEAFWASFMAALWVAPIELLLWLDNRDMAAPTPGSESLDFGHALAREVIGYALQWLAFPYVMLAVTEWLGRRDRYFGYFAAYNWISLPLLALLLVVRGLGLPDATETLISAIVLLYTLTVQWFIARHALGLSASQAVAIVILDDIIGVFIATGLGNG